MLAGVKREEESDNLVQEFKRAFDIELLLLQGYLIDSV